MVEMTPEDFCAHSQEAYGDFTPTHELGRISDELGRSEDYNPSADRDQLERLWHQAIADEDWTEATRIQDLLHSN